MPSKKRHCYLIPGLLVLLTGATQVNAAGDLSTLFTTPQERQLINANRYKTDEPKPKPRLVVDEEHQSPVQILLQEEVSVEYKISGISLTADGLPTVWINGQSYLDGEQLEDSSRIKVISGDDLRVRITAPDGKQYHGTSGEILNVSYMATVEN